MHVKAKMSYPPRHVINVGIHPWIKRPKHTHLDHKNLPMHFYINNLLRLFYSHIPIPQNFSYIIYPFYTLFIYPLGFHPTPLFTTPHPCLRYPTLILFLIPHSIVSLYSNNNLFLFKMIPITRFIQFAYYLTPLCHCNHCSFK